MTDAVNAVGEEPVGSLESVNDTGVFLNQFEDLLIWEADNAIGNFLELVETLLREKLAAIAFALERNRDKSQHERTGCFSNAGQDRTDTRAGAATQPRQDKNKVDVFAEPLELLALLFRSLAPALGVASRPQAAQALVFQAYLLGSG